MRILVVDNYDSFTYNLVQYFGELGATCDVVRNDQVTVDELGRRAFDAIVISPGPGNPDEAGISLPLTRTFAGVKPILGVCLGHQAIGQAFGARIIRAPRLMHGRTCAIRHDGRGVFEGLPSPFTATRYHSLLVDVDTLGTELIPTAWSDTGELMGLRHRTLPIEGVQFHPESFLTEHGHTLLKRFMQQVAMHQPVKAAS